MTGKKENLKHDLNTLIKDHQFSVGEAWASGGSSYEVIKTEDLEKVLSKHDGGGNAMFLELSPEWGGTECVSINHMCSISPAYGSEAGTSITFDTPRFMKSNTPIYTVLYKESYQEVKEALNNIFN